MRSLALGRFLMAPGGGARLGVTGPMFHFSDPGSWINTGTTIGTFRWGSDQSDAYRDTLGRAPEVDELLPRRSSGPATSLPIWRTSSEES